MWWVLKRNVSMIRSEHPKHMLKIMDKKILRIYYADFFFVYLILWHNKGNSLAVSNNSDDTGLGKQKISA